MKINKIIKSLNTVVDSLLGIYVDKVMMEDGRAPVEIMWDADSNQMLPHRVLKIFSAKIAAKHNDRSSFNILSGKPVKLDQSCIMKPDQLYNDYITYKKSLLSVNLELQINKTNAGVYTVTFGRKNAPLNIQEAAFAAYGLRMVSPAELGFLRATQQKLEISFEEKLSLTYEDICKEREELGDKNFEFSSRTNLDIFYDDRGNMQVVLVPSSIIRKEIGLSNLVAAYSEYGQKYVIPESQRDLVYSIVDTMLKNGTAFVAPHGNTSVIISEEFGENELTSRLFSDESLGIKAKDYGNWMIQDPEDKSKYTLQFNTKEQAASQKGPYLSVFSVSGDDSPSAHVYTAGDICRSIAGINGAFGVHFEKTAKGNQNYLNLFNAKTTIESHLPEASDIKIDVYNMFGQKVKTLVNEKRYSGTYFDKWDGTNDIGQKSNPGRLFL